MRELINRFKGLTEDNMDDIEDLKVALDELEEAIGKAIKKAIKAEEIARGIGVEAADAADQLKRYTIVELESLIISRERPGSIAALRDLLKT